MERARNNARKDHVELNAMGTRLLATNQPAEAELMFRDAINANGDYAPAYNNLGKALEAAGRRDEALAAYRQAVARQPGFREAAVNVQRLTTGVVPQSQPADE
jgi:Flp pilus assembly protein TadD